MNVRRLVIRSAIAVAVGVVGLTRPKTAGAAPNTCAVCISGGQCDLFEDSEACGDLCGLPADQCTPNAPECGGHNTRLVNCKAIE